MDKLKEHAKMESIEQIGKWTSLNIGVAEFFVWFICVIFMGLAPVSLPGPSCSHWNTELLRQRSHLRRRIGLCSRQVHLQQDVMWVMCEVHPKHRWDMLGHSRLWLENGGDPQLSTTINTNQPFLGATCHSHHYILARSLVFGAATSWAELWHVLLKNVQETYREKLCIWQFTSICQPETRDKA